MHLKLPAFLRNTEPVAVQPRRLTYGPTSGDERKPVQPEHYAAGFAGQSAAEPSIEETMRDLIWRYGQRVDAETHLLNQSAFLADLPVLLRQCPANSEIALIWIDVLNLRREFALWGPKAVEALVLHVADSLRSAVDPGALLGRFGARCFLVALPAAGDGRSGWRQIQSIVDALEPMRLLGVEIRPEVAAGVAFYPSDTVSAEELVRFSSLAASRAAASRCSRVAPFDASMNSLLQRDHQLEVEIRRGLEQHQFRLHYQPKISLETGDITGAEALMRWIHPEWGPVPQSEFIPIAERSELIHGIFEFALRTALWDTQKWRDRGYYLPSISVNASPANLRSEEFARRVRVIQDEIPASPARLEIEVTESMLLEDEALFGDRLRQVCAAGASVAIDDFGTRYTGFNLLRSLPLHTMKIDHCFVEGVDRSDEMQALCRTIVAMARQMKLSTVAEGIETAGELEVMREIGCDAGQGYLFQRPIPADEFAQFLHDWPALRHSLGFERPLRRASGR